MWIVGLWREVNGTVLPNHAKFRKFQIDLSAMGGVEEHLYAFERYNQRRMRRQESVKLGRLKLE